MKTPNLLVNLKTLFGNLPPKRKLNNLPLRILDLDGIRIDFILLRIEVTQTGQRIEDLDAEVYQVTGVTNHSRFDGPTENSENGQRQGNDSQFGDNRELNNMTSN